MKEIGEAKEEENKLVGTIAHEFIKMIEATVMTKSFKDFYEKGSNCIDLTQHKSSRDYKTWGKIGYINLAKNNPEKTFLSTAPEFFYLKDEFYCLNEK